MLNVITIHAIRKTSSLPKPLKTLLLSLAVSDLGVGLFVQPLSVALLAMKLEQNIENNQAYTVTQITYLISTNLFGIASFFGVTALSVDRLLAIHLHLRYQELVTHQRVVVLVISVVGVQYSYFVGEVVDSSEYYFLDFCHYFCSLPHNSSNCKLQDMFGRSTPCTSNPSPGAGSGDCCKVEKICRCNRLRLSRVCGLLLAKHIDFVDQRF